tara:strand:- start:1007 stop:1846 length:840 start_codon:yes stop_codon:yes gene_type:complete
MTTHKIDFKDGTTNELKVHNTPARVEDVILVLPAMGVRVSYYDAYAKAIGNENRVVYSVDLRGQGKSSIRASKNVDWGYREHIHDLDFILNIIKNKYPNAKVFLLGHSLGGQMACLYSAKYPTKINGLILIATCSVYYRGWRGWSGIKTLIGVRFIGLINSCLGYYPEHKMGFGGKQGKTEIKDWYKNGITGKYTVENEEIDYEAELLKTKARILAFTIKGDDFSPHKATRNLLEKFNSSSSIEHITVEGNRETNHFNWTKYPEIFKNQIDGWINITNS